MTHHPQTAASSLYTQVEVTAAACDAGGPQFADCQQEQNRILRELLTAQDRQNELLEELVSVVGASQRQRTAELNQWKQANPDLARNCHEAAEILGRVQSEFLETMTAEVNANADNLAEGEFFLSEFLDRFGPRMAHLNGIIQMLAHLGNGTNPANNAP